MSFRISKSEVYNNLIRFKDSLSEIREKKQRDEDQQQEEDEKSQRKYKVLLNRKTGDMRFAKKITSLEKRITKREAQEESLEDFKEIQIIVKEDKKKPAQFEICDSENQSLSSQEMDPLAFRVAHETVEILNRGAKKIKITENFLPEEEILKGLSSFSPLRFEERIENLPGWKGSIQRIQAEKLLENQPVGTYLLREGDELSRSFSSHFEEENHLFIHPYILTVVEEQKKNSDVLLLQTSKGWCVYQDNPNLNDLEIYHYFANPKALLDHLHHIAIHPIGKGG